MAGATAEGLKKVAEALDSEGGDKAMQLRVAENYLERFGNLAKEGNTLIVPANLSDLTSMIGAATTVLGHTARRGNQEPGQAPRGNSVRRGPGSGFPNET